MNMPIAAVAAMILLERGTLDLNMPVSEILPDITSAKVMRNGAAESLQQPVKMLHLLNMTSGLTCGKETTPEVR